MGKYIVTDLTRFKNPTVVCIAVIDMNTWQCLRPMPYLNSASVQTLNIHPGAILNGNITINSNASNPHIEDSSYNNLKYIGPASAADFKNALDRTLSRSVSDGFGVYFRPRDKHIPVGVAAKCSIVTVKIHQNALNIHEDKYNPGRIKVTLNDGSGHSYENLSITDRGFFDYAQKHQTDGKLADLQSFIESQEEIYLRIGVGRQWQIGNKNGYWLQVNGIYTFPDFLEEIRSY